MIANKPQLSAWPSHASLVLLYGAGDAAKREYPLATDAFVIGKSAGCDLVLQAQDVSQIHCVISRNAGGYSVRDCQSRAGIRVNGERLKEGTLHDGDVLQIGPFSFRVVLPPDRPPQAAFGREPLLRRLERKRQNLARLALSLRRKLREQRKRTLYQPPPVPFADEHQLRQQIETLQNRLRQAQQRQHALEQAERDLARDRALLTEEQAEFRQRVAAREREWQEQEARLESELRARREHAEADAAERRRRLEEEVAERRRQLEDELARLRASTEAELEKRRQQADAELARRLDDFEKELARRSAEMERAAQVQVPQPAPTAAHNGSAQAVEPAEELEKTQILVVQDDLERTQFLGSNLEREREEARKLLLRRRELDFYDRYLRRTRVRLREEQRRLEMAEKQLKQGFHEMQAEHQENLLSREEWAREHAAAVERLQRQEEAVTKAEAVLKEQRAAVLHMMEELRQLQQQIRERNDGQVEHLRRENEELRQQLEELSAGPSKECDSTPETILLELKHFREENEMLRQLLAQRDAELEELRQNRPAALEDLPAVEDVDSYEAELIQFRRQLENDRARLNEEIQLIRQRNEELEETTREIEMQLSKERADIARERTRLDRLRAELQAEIDRLQKDGGLTNRLAPVQRLREEISERKPGSQSNPLFKR